MGAFRGTVAFRDISGRRGEYDFVEAHPGGAHPDIERMHTRALYVDAGGDGGLAVDVMQVLPRIFSELGFVEPNDLVGGKQ